MGSVVLLIAITGPAAAQTAGESRGSDTQIGASLVGNSGNATATIGADFSMDYRQPTWRFESAFNAVRTSCGR